MTHRLYLFIAGKLLFINKNESLMPSLILPPSRKTGYAATIRIAVGHSLDSAHYVDISVGVWFVFTTNIPIEHYYNKG